MQFPPYLEAKLHDTGKGELMLSSRVISSWFNMDLSIMEYVRSNPVFSCCHCS